MGRRSALSTQSKLVLYKQILKPVWTYGIQLWGCTKPSNITIIQRFQNKILRDIVNAPWYVRNTDLHRDLNMKMFTAEIRRFASKHEERLLHHNNVEAIQLLDTREIQRRLKRTKPFELVSWTLTPYIRQCNTPTQLPIVSGKLTHVAGAVITANNGPLQRKHTNWTGWTAGRRLQQRHLNSWGRNEITC